MVEIDTVRRLAMDLPGAVDASEPGRLAFEVGGKGFAWSLMERDRPKAPRKPVLEVLAVRCPAESKAMLMEAEPGTFYETEHYRGYPAVLVRLEAVGEDELAALLAQAWRIQAPAKLARAWAAERG